MGKGNGERGGERMRAEERAVEGRDGEGLAGGKGGEWKEGQGQSRGGGQLAGVSGRGMGVEGALWGSPAGPTPGGPSWPSHG